MGVSEELQGQTRAQRANDAWHGLRTSFGFPSGLAMVAGAALGLGLPAVDDALAIDLPVLSFDDQSSARSLLETIGTTTVAVAGLSFSVTVVAFTLASSQLSPRVLRSFRGDRLSQMTLALFLGTFIYCLTLLVRLGVSGSSAEPPNLSVTLAVLLAFAAFTTFAAFIAHIVSMLQPASVIAAIHEDAMRAMGARFPGSHGEPEQPTRAAERAEEMIGSCPVRVVESPGQGYLNTIDVARVIGSARQADALVRQSAPVGSYVLPGQVVAQVWCAEQSDELDDAVRGSFGLGRQRTMAQDISFPIRQFADIALKGLSPGINDPSTAENAVEAMSAILIELAACEQLAAVRVDEEGNPRLLTQPADLDHLLRLGFDQVRIFAGPYPVVSARLLELLDEIERAAQREGLAVDEIGRQRRLIAAGTGSDGITDADREAVREKA